MAVSKEPFIQIQLTYIGPLPKVHKLRVYVPPPPPHTLFGGTFLRHCYSNVKWCEFMAFVAVVGVLKQK